MAALVPRPRTHLVRFHGLFASRARHRRLVMPAPTRTPASDDAEPGAVSTRAQMRWAQRLYRVFDIHAGRCPQLAVQRFACSRSSPTCG
jgi:hypothetical protein